MEARIKELLEAAGIRPESALERFMGNEGIYQTFAWKFLDDRNYGALLKAVEEGDAKAAFTAAHTLKGLCGPATLKPQKESCRSWKKPIRRRLKR